MVVGATGIKVAAVPRRVRTEVLMQDPNGMHELVTGNCDNTVLWIGAGPALEIKVQEHACSTPSP